MQAAARFRAAAFMKTVARSHDAIRLASWLLATVHHLVRSTRRVGDHSSPGAEHEMAGKTLGPAASRIGKGAVPAGILLNGFSGKACTVEDWNEAFRGGGTLLNEAVFHADGDRIVNQVLILLVGETAG